MINGSTEFNNAVITGGYPYIVRISENGTIIDCSISACTFTKGSTGSESFGVGTVFVPYVELEITGLNRTLENTDILVELGVQINANSTEWINLGYFRVSKVQSSVIKTNVTAVGRITAILGLITPTLPSTVTIPALINTIQSAVRDSGFSTFTISYSGLTLSTEIITSDLSGSNCKQLLEVLASIIGCYATEDNNGNIILFKYDTSTTVAYDGSRMTAHPVVNDSDFSLANIKVIKEEERQLDDGTIIPEVSFQYSTQIPVDWIMYNQYMENQSMFDAFCTNCIGLVYRPSTIVLANGDPRIEANDVLSITDINGAVYTVPALSVSNVLTGGITTTIIAPGETETEADTGVKGPISQQIDTLTSAVAGAQISADLAKTAANSAVASANRAEVAANNAVGSAGRAEEAAGRANTLLGQMQTAAEAAGTTLTEIYQDAETASENASKAVLSANAALDQLGIVEDVVGVLDWAVSHGTFTRTQDQTVQEGKVYFTYDSQSGDYAPVVNPKDSELSTYYELSVTEAMQDFVMSHLAVTSRGLWVLPNGIGSHTTPASGETQADSDARQGPQYKALLSASGLFIYDSLGNLVSTFGENISFSANRAQYIGNNTTFIAFNPANGGSITINGATINMGSGQTLDSILSNTLIYDHTYEYVRDTNNKPIGANFTAYLYRGGVDVKTEYPSSSFTWYLKKEEKETGAVTEELIGTGYTCHVDLATCGYGAEVIGKFTLVDDANALSVNSDNLTDINNENFSVRATGESIRVRDLTVSTTIFPTDKIMIVGGEDEHLVSIDSLQAYLNANLDKQVLFDTTANWNAQTTLVSDANTLYIYTDHQYDSQGNKVAGIKAGDGLAYVVDLPFTDAVVTEHIANQTVHITQNERTFWNNKVRCYYAGTEQLIFTTA